LVGITIVTAFAPAESGAKWTVKEVFPLEAILALGWLLREKTPDFVDESDVTLIPATSIARSLGPVFPIVSTISLVLPSEIKLKSTLPPEAIATPVSEASTNFGEAVLACCERAS
jgi:hypothetical protein